MKLHIVIYLSLLAACYAKQPQKTQKEGQPMPAFKILLSDSTSWLDTKDIPAGKPTVVFIFGPHCPFSKAQMHDFINNNKQLEEFHFLAITPYPFKEMKEFYESFNIKDYPNVKMGIDTSNFFGTYIAAEAVPYIAIYNKEKKLVKAYLGTTDFSQIKKVAFN